MKTPSPELSGMIAIILLSGTAFCMSCKLSAMPAQFNRKSDLTSSAGVILGESRMAFGEYFRRMTNLYNHRGFEARSETAFNDSIFQRWQKHISPQEHLHLTGDTAKEMLPWLWMAIKMDPHNVENYLVAAFAVSTTMKRSDIAHQILKEAQQKNPFNYQVQLEDAIIFIKEEKYIQARRRLTYGLILWPSDLDPESEQAKLEKVYILSYKALLHEINRETKDAIKCFKQINDMNYGDETLKQRIALLESGEDTSNKALQVLRALAKESESKKSSCSYGEQTPNAEHSSNDGCDH